MLQHESTKTSFAALAPGLETRGRQWSLYQSALAVRPSRWDRATMVMSALPKQQVFIFFSKLSSSGELRMQKLKSQLVNVKRSPFKAWSRSIYSQTCYAYCQGFLPCLFLPSRSTRLHFFQTSPIFPVLAVANTWCLRRPA